MAEKTWHVEVKTNGRWKRVKTTDDRAEARREVALLKNDGKEARLVAPPWTHK